MFSYHELPSVCCVQINVFGGGVRLSPLGTLAKFWRIVPVSDDG